MLMGLIQIDPVHKNVCGCTPLKINIYKVTESSDALVHLNMGSFNKIIL